MPISKVEVDWISVFVDEMMRELLHYTDAVMLPIEILIAFKQLLELKEQWLCHLAPHYVACLVWHCIDQRLDKA